MKQMIGNEERPYSTLEVNVTDEAKDYAGYHCMLITLAKTIKGGSTIKEVREDIVHFTSGTTSPQAMTAHP